MSEDRHSHAPSLDLLSDPEEIARKEVANGVRQSQLATEIIRNHVGDGDRPFRLRPSIILQLHKTCLDGLHALAGTFRNTAVEIGGSQHEPPEAAFVADHVVELCEYVNEHWAKAGSLHLAAYTLWKMNWIHPFADGNGRTARAAANVVLNIHLDMMLPGTLSIPDQIAADKTPYYRALEAADAAWRKGRGIDVSDLEALLQTLLARQLTKAVQSATSQ